MTVAYWSGTYWAEAYWPPDYWPHDDLPGPGGFGYRVFGNLGDGGAVDYVTTLATTAAEVLTWTSDPLDFGSDWTFAVRAFDGGTGLEDRNVDARVRVRVGPAGEDLARLPNAPLGLSARPTAGGTAEVTWAYNPAGQGAPPLGFRIYRGSPAVDYTTIAAVASYEEGRATYRVVLGGLAATPHQITVRAQNLSGEETNTLATAVTPAAAGPNPVASLAAAVVT